MSALRVRTSVTSLRAKSKFYRLNQTDYMPDEHSGKPWIPPIIPQSDPFTHRDPLLVDAPFAMTSTLPKCLAQSTLSVSRRTGMRHVLAPVIVVGSLPSSRPGSRPDSSSRPGSAPRSSTSREVSRSKSKSLGASSIALDDGSSADAGSRAAVSQGRQPIASPFYTNNTTIVLATTHARKIQPVSRAKLQLLQNFDTALEREVLS